jgi:hypothetical protein
VIHGRQPLLTRGGQRGGEGVEPVVLARVASREHPHPCRKLGLHLHHRLARARQPLRQVPTEASGVLHRPTALGDLLAQRSSDLRPARSCGKPARSRSSPVASSTAAIATDVLWGSTPMSTLMCVPPFRSELRHHRRERRTFRLRGVHTPLLSHSARRSLRRDASREQASPPCGRQEIRERSLKPVP